MKTLYCVVNKGDAEWMIGQKLDGNTNHAVYAKLYDLENVRHALSCNRKMVALFIKKGGTFEAFNPFIPE